MSRVGILGGTFDPPHNGHIAIALAAMREFELQKILFIPARYPPHKRFENVTSQKDRLIMLKLAVGSHPEFEISDIELKREGLTYTVDTLREIKKQKPEFEIIFIIGADNIAEMEGWHRPDEIFNYSTVVAFNRPGFEPGGKYKNRVEILSMPPVDISSTGIREKVKSGENIGGLVPDAVKDYIEKNSLYKDR